MESQQFSVFTSYCSTSLVVLDLVSLVRFCCLVYILGYSYSCALGDRDSCPCDRYARLRFRRLVEYCSSGSVR